MNIKNIKRYIGRTQFPIWTKQRIGLAHSYNNVKEALVQLMRMDKAAQRYAEYKSSKFYEKEIQQIEDILERI